MKPVKRPPFRKIAENELNKYFADLDPSVRNELATSLVRQWLADDGYAGFVTSTHQYWFQLYASGAGYKVDLGMGEQHWGRILSQDWHVAEEAIPALLHQLNLRQSVLCRTTDGLTIQLRIEA